MRMAYDNLADRYTVLASSAAISGYPVANVQDMRVCMEYRTSILTSAYVDLDLGYYDDDSFMVALVGHNLSSAAAITASFDYTSAFPSPSIQTLAWNEGMIVLFFSHAAGGALLAEDGDTLVTESGEALLFQNDYRYMRITITDAANVDGFLSLGRIWAGNYIDVSPSSLLDFKVIKKGSDVVIHGKDRQKWAVPGVGWRRFELSFPPSEPSMVTLIEGMYDHVGNHSSLIFCNFDSIRDYVLVEPCYVSIDGEIGFIHEERMRMTYSLNLEEDL